MLIRSAFSSPGESGLRSRHPNARLSPPAERAWNVGGKSPRNPDGSACGLIFGLRGRGRHGRRAPAEAVGITRRGRLVSGRGLRQAAALRLARERRLLRLGAEPIEPLLGPELFGRQWAAAVFGAVVDRILAGLGHAACARNPPLVDFLRGERRPIA